MKVLVVGLGTQGKKRKIHAGADLAAAVESQGGTDYISVRDVPLDIYDAALVCTPDDVKFDIIEYLLANKKHVLVEKPLWLEPSERFAALEKRARENNLVCYTAYNHRFEPHFMKMRNVIASGVLGKIYSCRMFYGNGTARLVRESAWRDQGLGVVMDLGSHLLDTCRYWFGDVPLDFELTYCRSTENKAPDHAIISSNETMHIELEMTMLMWKNHFTCDILAEKGSAHIESLCKWGPTTFSLRHRVLPSGRPREENETLEQPDPTWAAEYKYFTELCRNPPQADLAHDCWIQTTLTGLGV